VDAGGALNRGDVPAPLVSVIVPLYESQATVGACLEGLKCQTFRDFEVILVDSSSHARSASVGRAVLPDATYRHVGHRLLPQEARNFGAEGARGELLVFTDPDIYPAADWLDRLVTAWRERPTAVVLGAIACHGRRWLDRGVHLCKFNICLPGGDARAVLLGWSGNVLVERRLFASLGGWNVAYVQGDSVFTARARAAGHALWFEPRAVVRHDHEHLRFADFIRERFRRGREFAVMTCDGALDSADARPGTSRLRSLSVLLFSPFRVVNRLAFIGRAAAGARMLGDYWLTLPVVFCGVSAWYAGMCAHHWNRLVRGERAERSSARQRNCSPPATD
jgi:GT2 family glycosyltransferase